MRRTLLITALVVLVVLVGAVMSMAAAPYGTKVIAKGLLAQSVAFDKDPEVLYISPWSAPTIRSCW